MNESMTSNSSDTPPDAPQPSSETLVASSQTSTVVVDLRQVFMALLKWSWVIALATGFGIYSGAKEAHNFSPKHIALAVLGPFSSASSSSAAPALGSGSASVISLLTGSGSASTMTSVDRLIHVAGTLSFARHVQEKYGFMQRVFASSWDAEAKDWKPVRTEPNGWEEKIRYYLNYRRPSQRTLEDLAKFFSGVLQVKKVEGTPYVEVRVEMTDGAFALAILEIVLREGAAIIAEKDNAVLKAQSKYLENRLARARLIEHRDALVALLSEQARKEMMTSGDSLPMVELIEPPYVSKLVTEPNVRRLVGVPGLIGFVLSSILVVVITVFRRE